MADTGSTSRKSAYVFPSGVSIRTARTRAFCQFWYSSRAGSRSSFRVASVSMNRNVYVRASMAYVPCACRGTETSVQGTFQRGAFDGEVLLCLFLQQGGSLHPGTGLARRIFLFGLEHVAGSDIGRWKSRDDPRRQGFVDELSLRSRYPSRSRVSSVPAGEAPTPFTPQSPNALVSLRPAMASSVPSIENCMSRTSSWWGVNVATGFHVPASERQARMLSKWPVRSVALSGEKVRLSTVPSSMPGTVCARRNVSPVRAKTLSESAYPAAIQRPSGENAICPYSWPRLFSSFSNFPTGSRVFSADPVDHDAARRLLVLAHCHQRAVRREYHERNCGLIVCEPVHDLETRPVASPEKNFI